MGFHRALDGHSDGVLPEAWALSRVCEEGLASSLVEAWEQPAALVLEILDLRAFARAKDVLDTAEDESKLRSTPALELVKAIEGEVLKRELARKRAAAEMGTLG